MNFELILYFWRFKFTPKEPRVVIYKENKLGVYVKTNKTLYNL